MAEFTISEGTYEGDNTPRFFLDIITGSWLTCEISKKEYAKLQKLQAKGTFPTEPFWSLMFDGRKTW